MTLQVILLLPNYLYSTISTWPLR